MGKKYALQTRFVISNRNQLEICLADSATMWHKIESAGAIPLATLSESRLTQLGFLKTDEIVVYENSLRGFLQKKQNCF